MSSKLRIAIVGCAHGELDDIYATIDDINSKTVNSEQKIELLICCGDFQSIRDETDLNCLSCPPKFRKLGTFHHFYNGHTIASVPTIFIGGNHEASNYLQELHYGGYVAPNIFYLGSAGVVTFGGIRIAGLSGIYNQGSYTKGHFETVPYNNSSLRSVYHVREYEVYQLMHLSQSVDVFLSHDWPRGIAAYGATEVLLRKKPFFRQEVETKTLGNPATEVLLHHLKPSYWFSAHLHVKFAAVVPHPEPPIVPSDEKTPVAAAATAAMAPTTTKFLALDKCLPRREFLQVLTLDRPDSEAGVAPVLAMDPEWLAIVRATHHLASRDHHPPRVPTTMLTIEPSDRAWVETKVATLNATSGHDIPSSRLTWPFDFCGVLTASSPDTTRPSRQPQGNEQTDRLLTLLELPHMITVPAISGTSQKEPATSRMTQGVLESSLTTRRSIEGGGEKIGLDVRQEEAEAYILENHCSSIDTNGIDIDDV